NVLAPSTVIRALEKLVISDPVTPPIGVPVLLTSTFECAVSARLPFAERLAPDNAIDVLALARNPWLATPTPLTVPESDVRDRSPRTERLAVAWICELL